MMYKETVEKNKFPPLFFRKWSNKKWAILASFHKVILIGTLCFSYELLAQDTHLTHPQDSIVQMLVELEEVETTEEWPAQLEELSLKPVLLVSSKEINAAAATSPEDLLEYLPQLDIRQRGKHGIQADLSIMGGSFDQSMVLLNGINISDPQTGHFHLNIPLDLNSVQQIEIVTGASARRFGNNAFSGAINLVTQALDSTFLNAGFRYGQHHFYKGHLLANLGGKKLSTQLSFNASASDGYRENTDFKTTHMFIHSATRPGKLRLHVMAGINNRAFGANAFYSPLYIHQYEKTSTGLAAMKLVKKNPGTTWTMSSYLRLGRDHFLLDRHNPAFYTNDHLTIVGGVEINGKISTEAGLTRTGLNYRREEIRSTSLGEPKEQDRWVKFNDSITFTHGYVRKQFNWNINHSYAWGPVSISGGLLFHLNPDQLPRVYPGMDLKWRIPGLFSIYTSVNQSMRMPTFTDLFYQGPSNVGNPLLAPERATTFELGIFRAYKGFYASMNTFFRQGKDMIDWIWMEDEKWHTMNLTQVNAFGSDILLTYTRPNSDVSAIRVESASLSYTFTHLTRMSHEVNSRYLLDNLKNKVVAGTKIAFYKRIRLSLKTSYQERNGSYLAYDPGTGQSHSQPYENFILLDAKLSCSIWKFRLFAETTNLLDVLYNDIGNVVQPGRWFIAGFEIR